MAISLSFITSLFQNKGVKRTLSAALAGVAAVLPYFPELAAYQSIVVQAAGILGIAGVGQAGIAKLISK